MSTQYDYHIHQLLEPDSVLIVGKQKRESKATIFEKWDLMAEDRAKDPEAFIQREIEYQNSIKNYE
jgi:hypothetical protein